MTYQLKILTTAIFAVLILHKKLFKLQILALVILITGAVFVQLNQTYKLVEALIVDQIWRQSIITALITSFSSGLAGIYFEKILKDSDVTVWTRNIQLSLLSLPFALLICFIADGEQIIKKGFFYDYNLIICYIITSQAVGGLLVAAVINYSDNIIKGFITSFTPIISSIILALFCSYESSIQFSLGTILIIFSTYLYRYSSSQSDLQKSEYDV